MLKRVEKVYPKGTNGMNELSRLRVNALGWQGLSLINGLRKEKTKERRRAKGTRPGKYGQSKKETGKR
jgi:hypothetical protein